MPNKSNSQTLFLNVDLDLHAGDGFDELITAFGSDVFILTHSDGFLSVELNDAFPSVDETLARFVEVVRKLPPNGRKIWEGCGSRAFNIGVQVGTETYGTSFAISQDTVFMLQSIHAGMVLTVYPSSDARAGRLKTDL